MNTFTNEEQSPIGKKINVGRPDNSHDLHPSPEMWKNKNLMRHCYVGIKKKPRKSLIEQASAISPPRTMPSKPSEKQMSSLSVLDSPM